MARESAHEFNTRLWSDMGAVFRPFESKFYRTTQGRPVREVRPDNVAVLEIRASARVQVTSVQGIGFTPNLNPNQNDDNEEESRVTRIERITNPEDPNQYVDVEVIDRIAFRDQTRRRRSFALRNS